VAPPHHIKRQASVQRDNVIASSRLERPKTKLVISGYEEASAISRCLMSIHERHGSIEVKL
jgi:hypothetical protein